LWDVSGQFVTDSTTRFLANLIGLLSFDDFVTSRPRKDDPSTHFEFICEWAGAAAHQFNARMRTLAQVSLKFFG
jgi:hypothetical protein